MTTNQRRKRVLSGYLPDGSVVKIRTAAEYSYLVVFNSDLFGRRSSGSVRSYSTQTAWRAAKAGDFIVGLTEATLTPGGPVTTTKWNDGRIATYPRCYACDAAGLKVSTDFRGNKRPACANRHRDAAPAVAV